MKKIDLGLDFDEIRKRIEIDIGQLKPGKWAKLIGLSPQNISNIHGEARKNQPSLQYIIAVAKHTGKPIEWYLYGREWHQCKFCGDMTDEIKDVCKKVKDIVKSGRPVIIQALRSNIDAFEDNVKQAETIRKLEENVNHLKKLISGDSHTGTGKDAGYQIAQEENVIHVHF